MEGEYVEVVQEDEKKNFASIMLIGGVVARNHNEESRNEKVKGKNEENFVSI